MGMRAGILVLAGLMLTGLLVGWRASAPAQAAELELAMGKALFERAWVPAPTSTAAADGLGPLFSGRACTACHSGGGPARVSLAAGGRAQGIVVRFGDAAGRPDPRYGLQLQEHANPGLNPEGRLLLAGEAIRGVVPQPPIRLALNGPPPQAGIRVGLRAAPSLAGRGDLERIDASAALALADPDDRDGDGVSGRPRFIDAPGGGPRRLGRFGWKAAAPDLRTQVATAFALDMGLSSTDVPLPYGDCTVAAADCLAAPTGIRPGDKGQELDEQIISLVTRFVARQTTPRASPDAEGVRLLRASGCSACHVPSLPSGSGEPIDAFTDLLLHDLGGDLDDGVGEPGVASAEWRTSPLLDLGSRNGTRRYLHDGRAASIATAISLHGGEAASSRTRFAALSPADRRRLLQFLEGR
ncbi:MAG: di-heme oxidoredictase family protein [Rhodospirillales bacterium]